MKQLLFSTLVIVVFSTCKNKLEVLAPGKEMVSVYGILDATQLTQNIRINKVFLNENDALISAKNANEINYAPGEITVSLQRFLTGNSIPQLTTIGNSSKTEIVLTETVSTTEDGVFNNLQRIWQTTDRLYRNGEYKLMIKKTATGDIIASSQNVIIDSLSTAGAVMPFVFLPSNPTSFPNYLPPFIDQYTGLTPSTRYIDYSNFIKTNAIKFKTIKNAKVYDVIMRFHYIDSLLDNSVVNHFVDFNFNSQKGNLSKIDEQLSVEFLANDFYTNLEREITKKGPVANLKNRKSYYMEYIVFAGAESLSDFLEVNAPSNTIAQDKPYFTNITGGVGIFSSRSTCSVSKKLDNLFIDKIACNPSTFPLLFCNSSGVKPSTACP